MKSPQSAGGTLHKIHFGENLIFIVSYEITVLLSRLYMFEPNHVSHLHKNNKAIKLFQKKNPFPQHLHI